MNTFTNMTDEELVISYVGGANGAFDELLTRYQSKLFNYIMFVVRNEDTANDIFQDTFVKIITKLQEGKYVSSGKFAYWMTRITHNIMMDWYRHHKNERIVEATQDNDLSNLSTSSAIVDLNREREYVNSQVLDDVKKMMNTLPAPQREVVYMRFYQDLSFKEIAELTGVSINTALGRMRYAVLNLRRMAKEHDIQLYFAEA